MEEFSPIFLVSSERSGSNFLMSWLDRHEKLKATPTAHLFRTLYARNALYKSLGAEFSSQIYADANMLINASLGDWSGFALEDCLMAGASESRSVGQFLHKIYQGWSEQNGQAGLVVKLHQAHLYFDLLQRDFPHAKYIHLVRDPRGMVASWKHSAVFKGRVIRPTSVWLDDQKGVQKIRSGAQFHDVTFEELLTDPQATMKRMYAWLGLEHESEQYANVPSGFAKRNHARNPAWGNISKPPMPERIDAWRTQLDPMEIRYVSCEAHAVASDFGYQFAPLELLPLSGAEYEGVAGQEHAAKPEFDNLSVDQKSQLINLTNTIRSLESDYLARK